MLILFINNRSNFFLHINQKSFFLVFKTDLFFLNEIFFFFFYFTPKIDLIFFYKNRVLSLLQNRPIFLQKTFSFLYTNADLILFTKLFFFCLHKNRSSFFLINQISFSLIHKNRSDFFKRRGYIHKINLFELMLVKFVMFTTYHSYHA